MLPQCSSIPLVLFSGLALMTRIVTSQDRCPRYYCSCFSPRIVHCSGHTSPITLSNLEYILDVLTRTMPHSLDEFHLGNANIKDLPDNLFSRFPELKRLVLVDCKVESLRQDTFKGLTNLTELFLHNNSIRTFDFEILGQTNIQKLDLHSNIITTLDNSAKSSFPEMWLLNLADNKLTSIGHNILGYFPNLEHLVLRKNPLHSFAKDTFKGLGKLLTLDLSFVKFVTISGTYFTPLTSLEILILEASMDQSKGEFQNLKFEGLENLKRLNLMNNNIDNITDSFKGGTLQKLQYLDLSHNKITNIESGTFSSLQNLQILKLSYMKLPMKPIPALAFTGLPKLRYLDLQGNNLTELPLAALERIKLAKIGLAYGNNFLCNCSLLPMKSKIENGRLQTDIHCKQDSENIFLSQMTKGDLGCIAPLLNGGVNNSTVDAKVGATALIKCSASSTVEFPRLTYYAKGGDPVPWNKVHEQTAKTEKKLEDGRIQYTTVRKIFVRNVEKTNSGVVVCSASTKYGKSESMITLQVHDEEETSMPQNKRWSIAAIASSVTVLAVIIVIGVAIYCHRRSRRRREERNSRPNDRVSRDEAVPGEHDESETEAAPTPQIVISETTV